MSPNHENGEQGRCSKASGKLDEVDQRIIRCLRVDARQSARSIARAIGMSAGAVSERISRLEGAGVIRGYHADIDQVSLGYHMRAIVSLMLHPETSESKVIDHFLAREEVVAIYFVMGRWDVVLLARVRDQEHLRDFLVRQVKDCLGVQRSESMLILGRHAPSAASALARDAAKAD